MLEVELRSGIVAREHLFVVEDYRIYLMGVIELGSLVFVDNQRQKVLTLTL